MKVTASHMKWFHLGMVMFWILMIIPTVLWWSQSILWIAGLSIYALVVSHLAAYQGARAERLQEKRDE